MLKVNPVTISSIRRLVWISVVILFGLFSSVEGYAQSGSLDLTFNPNDLGLGDGPSFQVNGIMLQPDGKSIIFGNLTRYNGENTPGLVVRVDTNGRSDNSFSAFGSIYNTTSGPGSCVGSISSISAAFLQPDNKIMIAASIANCTPLTRIGRLNGNGSMDANFSVATFTSSLGSTSIPSVITQPDGKVLIAGEFSSVTSNLFNASVSRITRLNADGSKDTTFNTGSGPNNSILRMLLLGDGRIIISGIFTSYNGVTANRLARLNADGSLDTTFVVGTGPNSSVNALAVQSDGKLVIGGAFTSYQGTTRNRIARINTNGTLDAGFLPTSGASSTVRTITILSDGKMILGGDFSTYDGFSEPRITKISSSGTLDFGFSPGTGAADNSVFAAAVQSNGKILVGGSFTAFNGLTTKGRYTRLSSTGSIDNTFNPVTASSGTVSTIIPLSNGKFIISGAFVQYDNTTRGRIARVNANGSIDATFNTAIGADQTINHMALQSDGKLILGGSFTTYQGASRNRIARANADGTNDVSFTTGTGANNVVTATAVQSNGKIIVAGGFTTYAGQSRNRLTRLNTDGTLDTSFTVGTGANNTINNLVLQTDGKAIIGGTFTSYNGTTINRFARINSDGSRDTTFTPGTGTSSGPNAIVIQPDGKIIAAGNFTYEKNGVSRSFIVRINPDASVDQTFTPASGPSFGNISSIYLQPDGRIIVGGDFQKYDGISSFGIARLNSNGTIDLSFEPDTGTANTIFLSGFGSPNTVAGNVNCIVAETDGKIIIGGAFIRYAGVRRNRIARINGFNLSAEVNINDTAFCAGATIQIPYTVVNGPLNANNEFIVQLSDTLGSFASPSNIDTFAATTSGAVSVVIPSITPPGTHYRIRLVATSPAFTGNDNAVDLTIFQTVTPFVAPAAVTNMLPVNNTVDVSFPFTLSWQPANFASKYDLYVWPDTLPQPGIPYQSGLTAISRSFNGGLEFGKTYNWSVVSRNGECFSTNGPVQKFTMKHLPDLVAQNVLAPTNAVGGQNISVSWQVLNAGLGSTGSQAWTDAVYISPDSIFNSNIATYLGGLSNLSALQTSQSYSRSFSFNLSSSLLGTRYIIVRTDAFGQLMEQSESNNAAYTATPIVILAPPVPDLQVTSVVAPANAFSGDTIQVTYTVKNFGQAPANSVQKDQVGFWKVLFGSVVSFHKYGWEDQIAISDQPLLSFFSPGLTSKNNCKCTIFPGDTMLPGSSNSLFSLMPDSSYTASVRITTPVHVSGQFFIYARTNVVGDVYEGTFSGNDQNSTVMSIFLTPPPDITVSIMNAPTTAASGESVPVSWTVVNQGFTPTDTIWKDMVIISQDTVFNPLNAISLLSTNNLVTLDASDHYTRSMNVTIPDAISGNYYFYIAADTANKLFELNKTNNVRRNAAVTVISHPDLIVNSVTAPANASAGAQVNVSWQIKNQGAGGVFNRLRRDYFYLFSGTNFNLSTAIKIDSASFTESIAASATVTKQKVITLPNNVNASYRVFVITDFKNDIFESNENNNTTSSNPVAIALTNWADLAPQSFASDDTLVTTTPQAVTSYIRNIGTLAAFGTWSDSIYVSKKSTWQRDSAYYLTTSREPRFIGTGQQYQIQTTVNLPLTEDIPHGRDSSFYYFYVLANADRSAFENTDTANNVFRSAPVFLTNHYVDHVVTQVTAPDTGVAGRPVNIQFTVKNIGGATRNDYYKLWHDGVFLSADTLIDTSDIFFGSTTVETALNTGATYNINRSFNLTNGITGDFYLIAASDIYDEITGEHQRSNNYNVARDMIGQPKKMHVVMLPPPDLSVNTVDAPLQGQSGQPALIKWTVKNTGTGPAYPNSWQDAVYLSASATNISGATTLAIKPHNGGLAANASYTDSADIYLPLQANGNYFIVVKTDNAAVVFEGASETNNVDSKPITITLPPPADLVITSVAVPDTVTAGVSGNFGWILQNISANPATGITREGAYISVDTFFDNHDQLLGIRFDQINLPPAATDTQFLSTDIPGVIPGNYHLLVKADIQNNIVESNKQNNLAASLGQFYVRMKDLPLNVITPDILAQKKFLYYQFAVPDNLIGATLQITLNGLLICSNELYASFGSVPTRSASEFSSTSPLTGTQQIVIPELDSGVYYIAVYSPASLTQSQNITLQAQVLPFAILNVNSNKGGNTGNVTVKITGSKFSSSMQAQLVSANQTITASSVIFVNSTKVFATFNLNQKPLGIYDVQLVKPGNITAVLSNGFEIQTGNTGGFYVGGVSNNGMTGNPNAPGCSPNAGAGINQNLQLVVNSPRSALTNTIVPMTISYGNSGNVDIPLPSRVLYSKDEVAVGKTLVDLGQNDYELYLEFKEDGGPPGILRAGATGAIVVFARTTSRGTKSFSLK